MDFCGRRGQILPHHHAFQASNTHRPEKNGKEGMCVRKEERTFEFPSLNEGLGDIISMEKDGI
jgi:hypothetical protein